MARHCTGAIASFSYSVSPDTLHPQKDASQFREMFLALGLTPRPQVPFVSYMSRTLTCIPQDLYPWAHWITPIVEKRRYNTLFYLTEITGSAEATHDATETTAVDWLSPGQAIALQEQGQILLPPPTWFLLHEMSQYKSLDALLDVARSREFGKEITPILPSFQPFIAEDNSVPNPQIPPGRELRLILHIQGMTNNMQLNIYYL
jgi:hypothetical protein